MKVLAALSPNTINFYLEIFKKISKQIDGFEVVAIVTKPRSHTPDIWQKPAPVSAVYSWAETEQNLLVNDLGADDYERILNSYADVINTFWIADRQLGRAFAAEAIYPETPLMSETLGNHEKALKFIVNLIFFYEELLAKHKPDLILGAAGEVVYFVAQRMGIPFRQYVPTRIGNLNIFDDDIYFSHSSIIRLFNDENYVTQNVDRAKKYIQEVREKSLQPSYFTTAPVPKFHFGVVKELVYLTYLTLRGRKSADIRKPDPWNQFKYRLHHSCLYYKATKFPFVRRNPEELGKFVYFPLHVTPEWSTSLYSPEYTNQTCVIENLAKALPPDMKVVLKEHKPMLGLRPPGFYEHLASIPKVILAAPEINSHDLIKNSTFVSTITGTAALEAMMHGIPALLFGTPEFTAIGTGFVKTGKPEQLGADIEAVMKLGEPDEDKIIRYISCHYDVAIEIDIGQVRMVHTKESVKDKKGVIEKMANLLVDHLQDISAAKG